MTNGQLGLLPESQEKINADGPKGKLTRRSSLTKQRTAVYRFSSYVTADRSVHAWHHVLSIH